MFFLASRFAPLWAAALMVSAFWFFAGTLDLPLIGDRRRIWPAFFVAAVWFAALLRMDAVHVITAAVAAHAISRSGTIALVWVSRPAACPPALSPRLRTAEAFAAIAEGTAVAFLAGIRAGALIVAGAYLLIRLARAVCYRGLGGIDSASLAIFQRLVELFALFVAGFLI